MALVDALVAVLVGVILIIAGLVLAFFGASLVRVFMAILGLVIGGVFGFLGGSLLGEPLFALIFGIVGAIVGLVLFGWVVRAAVSLAAGIVVGSVIYILLGGSTEPGVISADTLVFAFIGFLVGAVLIYLFFNRLLGLITAFVGALLVGISLNFVTINLAEGLSGDIALAIGLVGGGVVFLAGAIRQSRRSD